MSVTYPSCATLPTFGAASCSSIGSFTASTGFSSSATCSSSGNVVTIKNVYPSYDKSASTTLAFSISLPTAHQCQDSNYIYVTPTEPFNNRPIEKAVVILKN